MRAEISSLDSKHRKKVETLKIRQEKALALQNQAHTKELADVRQKHQTVIQEMATEHDQHVRQLCMKHAEDLERQRNEMTSHHAGEIAFLKMQSHETPLHLAAQDHENTLGMLYECVRAVYYMVVLLWTLFMGGEGDVCVCRYAVYLFIVMYR